MTIHADFWRERRAVKTGGAWLAPKRDSNRQRCYNWENKHLRPVSRRFDDRQAAKGFARLLVKVAIRHMRAVFPAMTDHDADVVRASFKVAFTKETIGHCNANSTGAYFAKWGWTDVIIAHEIAHWADQWAHKLRGNPGHRVEYEPHGPRWRGWFVILLAEAGLQKLALETLTAERLAVHLPQ